METDIETTNANTLKSQADKDAETGVHYATFYDNISKVLLYAEGTARNATKRPKRTTPNPNAESKTHNLAQIHALANKCQKSLTQRTTLPPTDNHIAQNTPLITQDHGHHQPEPLFDTLRARTQLDDSLPPPPPANPNPQNIPAWRAVLSEIITTMEDRLADRNSVLTETSRITTPKGEGTRRNTSIKKTLSQLSRTHGRKKGGGKVFKPKSRRRRRRRRNYPPE
jgi:hypothetical protein